MPRRYPEDKLQIATNNWNKLGLASFVIAHHSANEREGLVAGAKAKAMGQMAGFWDWVFIWSDDNDRPKIAFIELKWDKGRLSENQRRFCALLDILRIPHAIARNLDEYIAAVRSLGIPCKHTRGTGI
jgi:hypothetical protein